MANQEYTVKTQLPKKTQNNVYLHFKEENVIQQGIELLKNINKETIKKYLEDRIAFYDSFLKSMPESNENTVRAQNKIEAFKESIEKLESESIFSTESLLSFLVELQAESEETFRVYEQEAVTNAQTIAQMIVESGQTGQRGEAIWIETPKALLAALILFVCRESHIPYSKHLGSAFRIMADLASTPEKANGKSSKAPLDEILDSFKDGDAVRLAQTAQRIAGDKTKASINVSLVSPLQIFADNIVVSQCSKTSFDVTGVADRPMAIFLNIPGSDTSQSYTILASLFIEQMYTELVKKAKSYPDGSLPRPCYFLIDEFGNIPRIPNFGSKVSLARSFNIRFNFVLQDFGQLDKQYKDEKTTIINNCNMVYLLTNDLGTAKTVSERLGTYTIKLPTKNVSTNDKGKNITEGFTLQKKDLFTPHELMDEHFKMGSSIYIQPRNNPYEAKTIPNYKMPEISHINSIRKNDLNTPRPADEVNYFSPTDYEKYIVAYRSFAEGCILDRFFWRIIKYNGVKGKK